MSHSYSPRTMMRFVDNFSKQVKASLTIFTHSFRSSVQSKQKNAPIKAQLITQVVVALLAERSLPILDHSTPVISKIFKKICRLLKRQKDGNFFKNYVTIYNLPNSSTFQPKQDQHFSKYAQDFQNFAKVAKFGQNLVTLRANYPVFLVASSHA